MLCCLIVLSASISVVKADSVFPNSSSQIYGSLDGGNGSPAQSQAEKDAAFWVQTQLNSSFTSSGYSVSNNVRYGTTVANVEGNAYWDALNRDHCTVFQYGHMAGFGTGYVDNYGNPIMYSELDPFISNNKYDLVVLWVCCQCETGVGSVDITNISRAWMNWGVASTDGYNSPDSSKQCFISFYGFSPWIGMETNTFYGQNTLAMKYFIQTFYEEALVNGYNIHDSLNRASSYIFTVPYTSSILCQGYNLWWPGEPTMGDVWDPQYQTRRLNLSGWYPQDFFQSGSPPSLPNRMCVFGDGSIYIYQPHITVNAVNTNDNSPLYPTFTINGRQVGTGSYYFDHYTWQPQQIYTIYVSSIGGYQFPPWFNYSGSYSSGSGFELELYYYPPLIQLGHDGTLTACYTPTVPTYSITFQANDGNGGGTMYPLGSQQYQQGTYVPIYAYHLDGYAFDHWYTSDPNSASIGNIYSEQTNVHMLGSGATVYPIFTPVPTYPTTVNAYATWDGYNYYYYDSVTIYKPAGLNYLSFGSLFVQAYNYYDSSTHYSDPDWYDLGTGTTIDVYYNLSGG